MQQIFMSGTKRGKACSEKIGYLEITNVLTSGKAEQSGGDFCLSQTENYSTLQGMFRNPRN